MAERRWEPGKTHLPVYYIPYISPSCTLPQQQPGAGRASHMRAPDALQMSHLTPHVNNSTLACSSGASGSGRWQLATPWQAV
eukprot:scaffold7016_cov123-Isochrysis_galbana.AAC.15